MTATFPAPLARTAAALRTGALELAAHINAVCDRIDEQEPSVQALLPEPDRRARLLEAAAELAALYPYPDARPPLYGILVGVKDIFRVDGFPTHAGSTLPPELFQGDEAPVVARLRKAGALILGKTVTTEFAYFEPGPTRNPHHLEHTPERSSSGSAAAVAAGFCPLALGSQTVGSVIRPAAHCGIVGFKPTYGRLSVSGVIPFSPAMDQLGLLAQDAAGMELAASALLPDWDNEPGPEPSPERPVLGVPEGPYLAQASDEARALFEGQVSRLAERGYTVRRVLTLQDIDAVNARHRRIIAAEAAAVHADWFARHERLYRPRTAALIREGQTAIASELEADRARHPLFAEAQAEVMRASEVDVWITPAATGPAPEGLASTGDPAMSLPWTQAGMPAVTIPAGRASNGLPVGLQCIAPRMRDRSLLRWAAGLEEALETP